MKLLYNQIIILLICHLISYIYSQVSIFNVVSTIYDQSPILRIRSLSFVLIQPESIHLVLKSGNQTLIQDNDYTIQKDFDGLTLKLIDGKVWCDLTNQTIPVALILTDVILTTIDENINQLKQPVKVAEIISTPSINANYNDIFESLTSELTITGTGLIGAKRVDLFFNPPLFRFLAYQVKTSVPLQQESFIVSIRKGYKWRETPGILKLIGIDTGAGPIKLSDGIVIANVVHDNTQSSITIIDTSNEQYLYHDDPILYIKGDGFNPSGNILRFQNGLIGNGINYTEVFSNTSEIILRLSSNSYWRSNVLFLPGYLNLLAINTNNGFIPVGEANGVPIATIFERPQIITNSVNIYRNTTTQFYIYGSGFPTSITRPRLQFSPNLIEDDYTIQVVDRKTLLIRLNTGKSWRNTPGELLVEAINTKNDIDGWITFQPKAVVAIVLEDPIAKHVEVFQSTLKVYQSDLHQTIDVYGNGFSVGMNIDFEPDIKKGVTYDLIYFNPQHVALQLINSVKWSNNNNTITGLHVKSIDGVTLGDVEGVHIATILPDPSIYSMNLRVHESQSKIVSILGHGFTNTKDVKVVLSPTNTDAYDVLTVIESAILLRLNPNNAWLPSYLSLNFAGDDYEPIPLNVTSIDTGAGPIPLSTPVTIGFVIKDRNFNPTARPTSIPDYQPSNYPDYKPTNVIINPTTDPTNKPSVNYIETIRPTNLQEYILIDSSNPSSVCTQSILSTCALDDTSYPTYEESLTCVLTNYNKIGSKCENLISFILVSLYDSCDMDFNRLCPNSLLDPIESLDCLYHNINKISLQCRMKWLDIQRSNYIPCGAEADYYCSEEVNVEDVPLCLSSLDYNTISTNCLNIIAGYQKCLIADQNGDDYFVIDNTPCWAYHPPTDDNLPTRRSTNQNISMSIQILIGLIIALVLLVGLLSISIYIRYLQSSKSQQLYVRTATDENDAKDEDFDDDFEPAIPSNKKRINLTKLRK